MPTKLPPFTTAEEAVLRQDIERGVRFNRIAARLGCTEGRIRREARRLNLTAIRCRPAADRLWARVDRTPGLGPTGDCWIWTGGLSHRNSPGHTYGTFKIDGVMHQAHRAAWTFTHGAIPEGMRVLHRCDHPPCVNPAHLFLGTQADNVADMIAKGRRGEIRPRRGERSPVAKLTPAEVIEAWALRRQGHRVSAIAARYHVTRGTFELIFRRQNWAHLTAALPDLPPRLTRWSSRRTMPGRSPAEGARIAS